MRQRQVGCARATNGPGTMFSLPFQLPFPESWQVHRPTSCSCDRVWGGNLEWNNIMYQPVASTLPEVMLLPMPGARQVRRADERNQRGDATLAPCENPSTP